MAACISHQRHILEAAFAYAIATSVPDGVMNVDVLEAAGFVPLNLCDCPSSPVEDFDDYNIDWLGAFPWMWIAPIDRLNTTGITKVLFAHALPGVFHVVDYVLVAGA